MWDFVVNFWKDNTPLSVFLCVALGLLTLAAIASAVSQNVGTYFGVAAILSGVWLYLWLYHEMEIDKDFTFVVALLLTYGGCSYLSVGFIGWIIRKGCERRKAKSTCNGLQYALPVRDNEYLRARLRSMACADDEICPSSQSRESLPMELAYARELLAKVREKELSATDVFQAEELGKLFALCGKKEGFSYADVRMVNEGFCGLLKLAAKYAVEL